MKYTFHILLLTAVILGMIVAYALLELYVEGLQERQRISEATSQYQTLMAKAEQLCSRGDEGLEYFVVDNGLRWGCRGKK